MNMRDKLSENALFLDAKLEELMNKEKFEITVDSLELERLISRAERIIIKEYPASNARILFESTQQKDIKEFRESLIISKPEEWFHCMCNGRPAVYLYKGKNELVQITNHHATSIRCSLWESDVPIADREKWLRWFDDRGIDGPRKEVEEMIAIQEENEKKYKRWQAAMPISIKNAWIDSFEQCFEIDNLEEALIDEIPDKNARIMTLFAWFGSGAGPWSGFPSYEAAAEKMLLKYSTQDLLCAVQSNLKSDCHLEGIARLFSGWDFAQERPDDLKMIPEELKAELWEYVKNTDDLDKFERAERVLNQV